MMRAAQVLRASCQACGRGLLTLAVWTLWLVLAIVLAVQIYIAASNQLTVPDFVLRRLEARLAESGLRATFRHTAFDPTGRVFVEEARVSLPAFSAPILSARALFVQLDLWSLALGRFEPRRIRLDSATAALPAMLSPSGRAEEIVQHLDATITASDRELNILALSARVADVAVSAHGRVPLPRQPTGAPPRLAEFLTQQFPKICRQIVAITEKIGALEQPSLDLVFEPSESGAIVARVTVLARKLELGPPLAGRSVNVAMTARVLVLGESPEVSRIALAADELHLPAGVTARGVHAIIRGRVQRGGLDYDVREVALAADAVAAAGFSATALSAHLYPRPLPHVDATIVANVMGAPLGLRAEADVEARSATLHFDGAISPAILEPLGERLHANVRQFFDFASLQVADGELRLGPDWRFEKLAAQVAMRRINARGVPMDEGHAAIEFDGRRFYSPDAFARIGPNFARGTYDHDLRTQEFRFVLQGRLRPMDISGWFPEWWPNFFQQFEFPVVPPSASVDVRGFWHDGRRANVFVFADAPQPIIRGAPLDRVRTRLFVRAGYVDGPEVFITRGDGNARGAFTVTTNPETAMWRTLDLALDSSLDLGVFEKMIGGEARDMLAPFKLSAPPRVKLTGRFDGPAQTGGHHRAFRVEALTNGEFRYHGFPLEDVAFVANARDDDVTLDNMRGRFAGGATTGHAKVWTEAGQRRLGFDFAIKDANLGVATKTLEEFFAHHGSKPAASAAKFVQEKAAVRVDLAASAEGLYSDPLSFHGGGNASLAGAEIGEVPLLGALSELLKFTALRFTAANANFRINGPRLEFPEITLRGANSAIDAHGSYTLDRRQLDFNAKIYPFQESGNLLKSVVGAVLTPLSNVFEVKLTGSLENPQWGLAIGPTNFIRSIAEPGAKSDAPPTENKSPAPATAPKP